MTDPIRELVEKATPGNLRWQERARSRASLAALAPDALLVAADLKDAAAKARKTLVFSRHHSATSETVTDLDAALAAYDALAERAKDPS